MRWKAEHGYPEARCGPASLQSQGRRSRKDADSTRWREKTPKTCSLLLYQCSDMYVPVVCTHTNTHAHTCTYAHTHTIMIINNSSIFSEAGLEYLRSLSPPPPAQQCSMSSMGNEKIVCEFLSHAVKIRTGGERSLCKSLLFQLLFAHILCNYGQREGIFHSHSSSDSTRRFTLAGSLPLSYLLVW